MKITITPELLAKAKTDAGGYTKAQLAILGIDWPPVKGWARAVIGRELDAEQAARFVEAREKSGT